METAFRAALLAWLAADPLLAAGLNTITEEAPLRASPSFRALAVSRATKASPASELIMPRASAATAATAR